jgi:NADPH:quinone reductase-like Zn-dependent oxidoreductase
MITKGEFGNHQLPHVLGSDASGIVEQAFEL